MNLYLMRHAESEDGAREDATRQLTDKGREQVATMADFMVRQVGRVDLVFTSDYRRALDTAIPMARALGATWTALKDFRPDRDPSAVMRSLPDILHARPWIAPVKAGLEIEDVLVVSHHPLINAIAEKLIATQTDDVTFHHAHTMHIRIEEGGNKLRWFVGPRLVERGERESGIIEAAAHLCDAMEAALPSRPISEALKHDRHARHLAPLRRKAQDIFAALFREQAKDAMPTLAARAKSALESSEYWKREAAADPAKRARANRFSSEVIPQSLAPLRFKISGEPEDEYSALINSAVLAAGRELAAEMKRAGAEVAPTKMGAYLRDHSLTKLTGDWTPTSIDRLRSAVSDAYEKGGTYDDIVQALRDTYADFSTSRAEMIAQTEMNDAYCFGRLETAHEMGFTKKSWDPDGEACEEICVPNVEQGEIDIDEDFESGDDAPPAHPRCDCGINFS